MTYPNAYKGVEKIYKAEKYGLAAAILAVVLGVLVFFLYILGGTAPAAEPTTATAFIGIAIIVISIVIAILAIAEALLTFFGLKDAAKDDDTFKTAYYLSIASLVISIIASLLGNVNTAENSFVTSFSNTFSQVLSAVLVFYVIQGIMTLAGKLNKTAIVDNGKTVFTILAIAKIGSSLFDLIIKTFNVQGTLETVLSVANIAFGILTIFGYFAYLKYLKKATSMLEQN